MPAEEEKCYFFEPQVEISLNQAEIAGNHGYVYICERHRRSCSKFLL